MLAHLRDHACVFIREGGRHSIWGNPANNMQTAVPRHTEIQDRLARKICEDLKIPQP